MIMAKRASKIRLGMTEVDDVMKAIVRIFLFEIEAKFGQKRFFTTHMMKYFTKA